MKEDTPVTGWTAVAFGAIFGGAGTLLLTTTPGQGVYWAGLALLWLAGVFTTIGAVAVGVTYGLLRAEYERTPR